MKKKKPKLISQSAFARLAKISRQSITKAITKGKLRKHPGTTNINLNDPSSIDYLQNETPNRTKIKKKTKDPSGTKQKKKATKKKTGKVSPKNEKSGKAAYKKLAHDLDTFDDDDIEYELPDDVDYDDIDLERISKAKADRYHKIEQTKKIKIERLAKEGLLIERTLVQQVFGQIYMIDSNQFKTMGDKLAPDIAALAGIDDPEIIIKINEKIESAAFKILKHIKADIDKFLLSIKAEEIKENGNENRTNSGNA